jgi:hypothetical protein
MADIIADLNQPLAPAGERERREGRQGEALTAAVPFLHVQGVAHASSTQAADMSTDLSAPSTSRSIGVSELAREVGACIGKLRDSVHACMRSHTCVRLAWR